MKRGDTLCFRNMKVFFMRQHWPKIGKIWLTVLDLVNLSSHLMASSGETLLFDKSMYPIDKAEKTHGKIFLMAWYIQNIPRGQNSNRYYTRGRLLSNCYLFNTKNGDVFNKRLKFNSKANAVINQVCVGGSQNGLHINLIASFKHHNELK